MPWPDLEHGAAERPLDLTRRLWVRAGVIGASVPLALLAGCTTPLPMGTPLPASDPAAERLLLESAEAHGMSAYRRLHDINVRYAGAWRPFIDLVQPVVVDKTYRGGSEERLMPAAGIVAQAYTGSDGRKQVAWQRGDGSALRLGEIAVWRNGVPDTDADVLASSAVVAECYGLFLLGPMWLAGRGFTTRFGDSERVDGQLCDVVLVWKRPGFGRVSLDRVALCVDRATGLTRRVRFTLEGFSSTQGAVAEVDTFDYERRFGVMWPMRSYEAVVHPLRLPAHDWHIAGLDVDRGYDSSALLGSAFTGLAARPATPL